MNNLAFYFSFRSPHAWLAFYRLSKIADRLSTSIEYTPLFLPKLFPSDPVADTKKRPMWPRILDDSPRLTGFRCNGRSRSTGLETAHVSFYIPSIRAGQRSSGWPRLPHSFHGERISSKVQRWLQ
ncbi:MAG TPA: hypothetical protein VEB01_09895 [Methylocaldum sp.]|nr:hypothetical protein [Methylocaldum sp.]HYE35715.1 hypothetical protein [Methylocaldum sp.]